MASSKLAEYWLALVASFGQEAADGDRPVAVGQIALWGRSWPSLLTTLLGG